MTNQEAIKEFRSDILPIVIEAHGPKDKAAVREAWNNWTDMLQKEGRITPHQYDIWMGPQGY